MKKSHKLLLLGAALTTSLTFSAAAADFTGCADALNQMGLFSGTDKGYELDRAPSRTEAAVMLVRLLGGEQEATEKNYTTPFTDVPGWASPYVGWLYENNLTSGTSATTFGSDDTCTAQMYATFLLRSLGYQDSGDSVDFQFNDAIKFAEEKGVADSANYNAENFLRDHVVAMSYTALSVQPKDAAHDTLLDQLVADGAIDSAKSADTKAVFSAFKEFNALNEKMADITDMGMTIALDANVKLNGTDAMTMKMNMDAKAKMDMENLDKSQMSISGKGSVTMAEALGGDGKAEEQDMSAYYADGKYYVKTGEDKIVMPMSFGDTLSAMDMAKMANSNMPISAFNNIKKNSDGSFSVAYDADTMNGIISKIMASTGMTEDVDVKLTKCDMTITPKDDSIGNMKADMDMSMTMLGQTMDMTMVMDCAITETGDSVKVEAPTDLDTYKTMEDMLKDADKDADK
jgi:hypothetical protein